MRRHTSELSDGLGGDTTSQGKIVHIELGVSLLEDGKPPGLDVLGGSRNPRGTSSCDTEGIIDVEDLLLTFVEHLELEDARLGETIVDENVLDS